jgi:3-hydroxyisobutyrate dehydrogenase
MLPAGKHVLGVWQDVLAATKAGALLIDCSTIDVESARAAHALATGHGLTALDAPVSGGVGGAQGATLTFMCGGATTDFARARPVLEAMGKKIVHCGEAGAGQAAKICNNMILGISKALRWLKSSACRIRPCSMSPRPRRASAGL